MKQEFRCNCPITSALDILGDKWMLVLVKHMLIEGKNTFKDFVESDEAIATNILSSKLKLLEQNGLVEKRGHPTNRKTNLYLLTEKGLDLAPVLLELAIWSDHHVRDQHPSMAHALETHAVKRDKQAFIEQLKSMYAKKNPAGVRLSR